MPVHIAHTMGEYIANTSNYLFDKHRVAFRPTSAELWQIHDVQQRAVEQALHEPRRIQWRRRPVKNGGKR